MRTKVLFTLLIFIYSPAYSQVDYNNIRSEILTLECGGLKDSLLVQANIDTLQALSLLNFKNKHRLYRDLGHNYYLRWTATRNDTFLADAIHFFHQSIETEPEYGPTYLELVICYYFQNNCQSALQYIEYYQLHTKRKNQDTSQVNHIINLCN